MATSAWSTEAWTDTQSNTGGAAPIMQDDFSSYSIGQTLENAVPPVAASGCKWHFQTGAVVPSVVVGTGGRNGGNCLHFNYKTAGTGSVDSSDSFAQQNFTTAASKETAQRTLAIEFYLMTTAETRVDESNDKFIVFYNKNHSTGGHGSYGRSAAFLGTRGGSPNTNRYGWFEYAAYKDSGNEYYGEPWATDGVQPWGPGQLGPFDDWWRNTAGSGGDNLYGNRQMLITPEQAGTWVRYRYLVTCPSGPGATDGKQYAWRDDVLIHHLDQCARTMTDGDASGEYYAMDGGYLLGYFNAGFTSDTTWKMDDVKIYDTDPGWT